MKRFQKHKSQDRKSYDPALYTPIIRSSICTGEKVAGFRSADGRIHEVALIRTDRDLDDFRREYGITGEIETEY